MPALSYTNDALEAASPLLGSYRSSCTMYVNGSRADTSSVTPTTTLLAYLRGQGYTGTKLGCAEGGCGACTVMLSRYDVATNEVVHKSVNACLYPAAAADNCMVTTVEGIGSVNTTLDPVQQRMVDAHGSQCGFCTPGIVMSMYTLFRSNPNLKVDEVEEHMDGNLCRCTGYRPIWDAAKSLCDDARSGPCGESCASCPERDECEIEQLHLSNKEAAKEKNVCTSSHTKFANDPKFNKPYSSYNVEHTPFPEALKSGPTPYYITNSTVTWFNPASLAEMLSLKTLFPAAKIVVGNTEIGIEQKFKAAVYEQLIYGGNIPELQQISTTTANGEVEEYIFGACTPLSSIQAFCHAQPSSPLPDAIHNMLRWFASTQIRNTASLSGNLATASPIADMNPMLSASDASVNLVSSRGQRSVKVKDFFLSYRKTSLAADELILSVTIPAPKKYEYILPFKQAKRREDDISIVTAGIRMRLKPVGGDWIIDVASFAYGGMSFKTVSCPKTEQFLVGQKWNLATIDAARDKLGEDLPLPDSVPGGQPEYRRTLATSFLFRFYIATSLALAADIGSDTSLPPAPVISENEKSAAESFVERKKPTMTGTQTYPAPKTTPGLEDEADKAPKEPVSKPAKAGAGLPETHQSGPLHVTGEALYTDDIPLPRGSLQGVLIHSNRAGADIKSIDTTAARAMAGVVKICTYDDLVAIGGNNEMGPVIHDEEVFAQKHVNTVGKVLGIVCAETLEQAEAAARAVVVTYENEEDTAIVTIEQARKANSFYDMTDHVIEFGDIKAGLATEGATTVTGKFRVGGQEHFYLECMSTLCVPTEGNTGMTVYSSTQAVTKTQTFCASAAGLPMSKVVCHMKRMGGGFGGKETRSVFVAAAAAVGAKATGRPVRVTLDRNVDMQTTGQRHAFVAEYTAAAVKRPDGSVKLVGLDVNLFSNGGCALDLSGPVMDRALFHVDGSYNWGSVRAHGIVCKTIQAPHTAYRGFGGPQGIAVCEHIIDRLALKVGVPSYKLRADNFYAEGDCTHFRQVIEEKTWNVPRAFDDLIRKVKYEERLAACDKFNSENKYKKRGVAVLPTKFGIAFTAKFMNQGGALVHLYQDGTVLISHGGTEMGQGLHTKMCQVAATAFNIPVSRVFIDDTSSDKVANTIPTAASQGTDIYGMACLDACRQILKNIQPFRDQLGPDAPLAKVAGAAHFARVDLSAHGWFTISDARCGYDWTKPMLERGQPFNYFTQGSAFSEVEIDLLTGDHRIIKSDVVVDVGSSINPAIDIGQIEGAFVQGAGWSTTEELIWGDEEHEWVKPAGKLFTQGPGFYKPPAFNDMPETFNVTLMDRVSNKFAVMSSKAIGEPPFFLGATVFFALQNALISARKELGEVDASEFVLNHPATSERIRMAVCDELAKQGGAPRNSKQREATKEKEEERNLY
jgi:xanthine dehydrogenase/oxidase